MTFLRAWLMVLFGMALILAVVALTWVLGDVVTALTGSKVVGAAVSVLPSTLLAAWLMTLPRDNRFTTWIVRLWRPPHA